jgi:hypothetical protein
MAAALLGSQLPDFDGVLSDGQDFNATQYCQGGKPAVLQFYTSW